MRAAVHSPPVQIMLSQSLILYDIGQAQSQGGPQKLLECTECQYQSTTSSLTKPAKVKTSRQKFLPEGEFSLQSVLTPCAIFDTAWSPQQSLHTPVPKLAHHAPMVVNAYA